jgi:hypothetical protein
MTGTLASSSFVANSKCGRLKAACVGDEVGVCVGDEVGVCVGDEVGVCVGDEVGVCVGDEVGASISRVEIEMPSYGQILPRSCPDPAQIQERYARRGGPGVSGPTTEVVAVAPGTVCTQTHSIPRAFQCSC